MDTIIVTGLSSSIGMQLSEDGFGFEGNLVHVEYPGKTHSSSKLNLQPQVTLSSIVSPDAGVCIKNKQVMLYHLASLVPSSETTESDYIESNVKWPSKLIDSILNHKPSKLYIVNISSTAVYDRINVNSEILLNSTKTTFAEDRYGYSKLQFENCLREIIEHYPNTVHGISIRVPVLLGKYMKNNFLAKLKKNIKEQGKIKIGYPDAIFNACFAVDDIPKLAAKFVHASEITNMGHVIINGRSNDSFSLRTLLNQGGIVEIEEIEYPRPPVLISNKDICAFNFQFSSLKEGFSKYVFS
jgi:nucleoside-diphosphate-sugar epimerase